MGVKDLTPDGDEFSYHISATLMWDCSSVSVLPRDSARRYLTYFWTYLSWKYFLYMASTDDSFG